MPLSQIAGALVVLACATAPLLGETPPLFHPFELHALDGWAEAVAIGDVNSDGRNDVVMTTSDLGEDPAAANRLFVYVQGEDGELAAPVSYPGSAGDSVAIGDVNSDGRNDVIVDGVGVFLQAHDGSLRPMEVHRVSSLRVATADFNGDGRTDVVSIPWGSNSENVDLFLQDSKRRLLPSQVFQLRHHGYDDLEVGDLTGDGLADLVVVSGQGTVLQNIGVLPQIASGGFGEPVYYDTGHPQTFNGVAIGDFDHDGIADLALTSNGVYGEGPQDSQFAVLHGLPGGGFGPAQFSSAPAPGGIAAGDLDLDGRDDAVALLSSGSLGVFLQDREGRLQHQETIVLPFGNANNPHGLAIGDVDSDGLPDVAVASDNYGLVVLRHAGRLAARACIQDGESLCLLGDRFEVRTSWEDQHNGGRRGEGRSTERTDQSGTFWFFSPESTELMVKALDGSGVNDRSWFFFGALSDVGYRISVLDTLSGELKAYVNPPGRVCGRADVSAFPANPTSPLASAFNEPPPAPVSASGSCSPRADALCLLDGRIQVEARWRTHQGAEGTAMAIADTDGSGFFWFFSPQNLELAVKTIDGRPVNDRFWFFYGALSDVEYWITVTDTATGKSRTYHNEQGNFCGGADIEAL